MLDGSSWPKRTDMATSRCYVSLFIVIAMALMCHYAEAQYIPDVHPPDDPSQQHGPDSIHPPDSIRTGTEWLQNTVDRLHVYPNPAGEQLFVDCGAVADMGFVLLDMYGREVKRLRGNAWNPVADLPSGTYFMVPSIQYAGKIKAYRVRII